MHTASVEQSHASSEWFLDHDIAQDTGYVEEIDRRLGAARKRLEDAHFALLVTRAPEEITGECHTDEEIEVAATDEHFAWREVADLEVQRTGLVDEIARLKREQAAQQRRSSATIVHRHVPTVRPRTGHSRPRERRERRARRSSSSSSGDDSSGSTSDSDSDPPGLAAGLLVVHARGPPRPSSYRDGPAPCRRRHPVGPGTAVGAAAPTSGPRRAEPSRK